jgi:hypothetical protein
VDLHDKRSVGWQRRLIFVHHLTFCVDDEIMER